METRPVPEFSLIKVPRQARSIVTVHAVLDAAKRILVEEGAVALNTNHVAEVAGVSPGSLYQYFSSREKIAMGVVERGLRMQQRRVAAEVAARKLDAAAEARVIYEFAADGMDRNAATIGEVLEVVSLAGESGLVTALQPLLLRPVEGLLEHHPEAQARGGAAALAAVVDGAFFAMLRWVVDRPPQLSRDGLVASILRMLRGVVAFQDPAPVVDCAA